MPQKCIIRNPQRSFFSTLLSFRILFFIFFFLSFLATASESYSAFFFPASFLPPSTIHPLGFQEVKKKCMQLEEKSIWETLYVLALCRRVKVEVSETALYAAATALYTAAL